MANADNVIQMRTIFPMQLLSEIGLELKNFTRIAAHSTGNGCRAVFKDKNNGQQYEFIIRPIDEKEVG